MCALVLAVLAGLAVGCTFSTAGGGQGGGLGEDGTSSEATEGAGPISGDGDGDGGGATLGDGSGITSSTTSPPPADATSGDDGDEDPSTGSDPDGTAGSTGTDTSDPPECDGLFWAADFSVDPTTLDVNADATPDWAMRDGNPFPAGELSGGIWVAKSNRPLDTRPLDDFAVRTLVDLRMRATAPGGNGAVFWVNVDYDVTFSPIWVSLALEGGDQLLRLHGKTDNATSVVLHSVPSLGDGLVDVSLDIDTEAGEVALWVNDAYEGTFEYSSFPIGGNDDRFATLFAWDTTAEFDAVTITQCP